MRVLLIALALPGGAGGALAGPVPSDGGRIAQTELSATAAEPQHLRGEVATGPSATGIQEWIRQVEGHPGSTSILDRAAEAVWPIDETISLRWLLAAEKVDPKNPRWPGLIGSRNCLIATREADAGAQYAAASRALAAFERAFALMPMRQDRLRLLDDAATAAYLVKRDDKAERFAQERLKRTDVGSPDNADAVNHANTILGLTALRRGDVPSAKDALSKAGDVNGSPTLNAGGPDFRLARALLEKGERDAVADYLEACAEFWTSGKDRLARWRKEVAAGRTPDFNQYK